MPDRSGKPEGEQERPGLDVAVRRVQLGSRPGLVVTLPDRVDAAAAGQLRELLARLTADGGRPHLIVDATPLARCEESLPAVMALTLRRIRPGGGRLALAGVHGVLARRLVMTRLDTVFELFPDVPTAESALAR